MTEIKGASSYKENNYLIICQQPVTEEKIRYNNHAIIYLMALEINKELAKN